MNTNIESAAIVALSKGAKICAPTAGAVTEKSKPKKTRRGGLETLEAARTIAADHVAQMPTLKPNETTLIENYMATGNKAEAYRLTFPDKAKRWKPQSIRCEASKAFAKPKISETIRLLTLAGMFGAPSTLENHIAELRHIKTRALDNAELSTARLCEVNIGQVSRLYVSDVVVEHRKPNRPEDLVKQLAPGNALGQKGILDSIRAARAKPIELDVAEIVGEAEIVNESNGKSA